MLIIWSGKQSRQLVRKKLEKIELYKHRKYRIGINQFKTF